MNLYHIIGQLIPESKIKNLFRNLFYKIAYSFTFGTQIIIFNKEKNITGKFYRVLLKKEGNPEICIKGYEKLYQLKQGDIVVDAGAFIGWFSVYASQKVGDKGRVICFEPEDSNYSLLKRNIILNNLKNVILIKKGLWNEDRILKFKTQGPISTIGKFENENNLFKEILVTRLDTTLKKLNLKKVDFIKMDIEGAEIQAVEGAKEVMRNNNIHFAIASYHEVNGEKTYKKLEEFFEKNNYKAFTDYPIHLTTYASKKN
jgi:FkbM family methyltransferase